MYLHSVFATVTTILATLVGVQAEQHPVHIQKSCTDRPEFGKDIFHQLKRMIENGIRHVESPLDTDHLRPRDKLFRPETTRFNKAEAAQVILEPLWELNQITKVQYAPSRRWWYDALKEGEIVINCDNDGTIIDDDLGQLDPFDGPGPDARYRKYTRLKSDGTWVHAYADTVSRMHSDERPPCQTSDTLLAYTLSEHLPDYVPLYKDQLGFNTKRKTINVCDNAFKKIPYTDVAYYPTTTKDINWRSKGALNSLSIDWFSKIVHFTLLEQLLMALFPPKYRLDLDSEIKESPTGIGQILGPGLSDSWSSCIKLDFLTALRNAWSYVLLLMFGYIAGYKFGLFRELYYEQKPGEVFNPEHYNNMQMSENFVNKGMVHWYSDLTNF